MNIALSADRNIPRRILSQVENAMLARLKAASDAGAIPYAYLTLESWPKDFDSFLSAHTIKYPAAWAAFAGAKTIDQVSRGLWRAHCSFDLVVAAQSNRNEESRRLGGSPSGAGSYQLATDALRILADQTLGMEWITPLDPISIFVVDTSDHPAAKQLSIYAVSFHTTIEFAADPILPNVADFAAFNADFRANFLEGH